MLKIQSHREKLHIAMKAIVRDGIPEQINGPFTDNNGTQHPRSILRLWSAEELAAIDVYEVQDGPVPEGHVITGSSLEWDGETVTRVFTSQPAPPVTPDQIQAAVSQHIEEAARSRGYDSVADLALDKDSAVEPLKADAEAFMAWRDEVRVAAREKLIEIEKGEAEPPADPNEFVADLPPIVWTQASYMKGDIVEADGKTWQSLLDHNVWQPGTSGWREVVEDGYPAWLQPTGAHDAYGIGDRVTHNGSIWESTQDPNTWEPGVFGWDEVQQ